MRARTICGCNCRSPRVVETGLPLIYLNQVGGQDELVFDGASFVLNADRRLAVQLPSWEEASLSPNGSATRTDNGLRAGQIAERRRAESPRSITR